MNNKTFMKKNLIVIVFLLASFLYAQTTKESNNLTSTTIDNSEFIGSVQIALSNADYMVTAGDIYRLNYVANGIPVSYSIAVDSSYKIRVSNLAVLDASGKTYVKLKREVEDIVQKNYAMSGVQFVLLNPGSFKVVLNGEVKEASEKTAWALTRLSTLIKDITTEYSSLRNITITSAAGRKKTYDLFKAMRYGDFSQNPYVKPGDIITIGRIERKASISGAVERPGSYELLAGENLKDLIEAYGGGLKTLADTSRIELIRVTKINSAEQTDYSGKKIYLNQEDIDRNYQLEYYDSIFISNYRDLRPVMFIEGAILAKESASPDISDRRSVQFEDGTNYASLIREYRDFFVSETADLASAYIIRGNSVIPININEILYDASFYSWENVQRNDILRIPFKQLFVSVAGSVHNPGRYPYIPDRDYNYYIGLAGGFISEKNTNGAVEILDIHGNELSKEDFITPETTITAKSNSALYKFNQYSGVITTSLTAISTAITIIVAVMQFSK